MLDSQWILQCHSESSQCEAVTILTMLRIFFHVRLKPDFITRRVFVLVLIQ